MSKALLAVVLALWFAFTTPALAADLETGAKLFEVQCAGCHINGGNIVRRGKTLKLKALERNGYASIASISDIITNGKGNMSAYKDRLTQSEIEDVAAYVLDRANKDWH